MKADASIVTLAVLGFIAFIILLVILRRIFVNVGAREIAIKERRYFGKGEHSQGHTAAPQVEPAEHEAELFAKRMAEHLEKARVDHRFDRLHLIAAPKFLGQMRRHLGKEVESLVDAAVAKDVAWFDAKSIADYIRDTSPPT